jgi:hypothetical protein
MVAGAGLVAWSAAIHLDLWHTGYRDIATIGPLFLAQSISGFVLAALIATTRRFLPALAGALFLAATIGGFVWSTEWGLFGFQDSFGANFASSPSPWKLREPWCSRLPPCCASPPFVDPTPDPHRKDRRCPLVRRPPSSRSASAWPSP